MEIKIINKNNESITFTSIPPFTLTRYNDDGAEVLSVSQKGMLQDGETYINSYLNVRYITLNFAITANSNRLLNEYKRKLYDVLNPKLGECELHYKTDDTAKKINVITEIIPSMIDSNICLFEGTIRFTAYDPYWKSEVESRVNIAEWKGKFKFPLILNRGVIMGYREPSLIVNVNNSGDSTTGLILKFKSKGSVTNPSLFNLNTKEYIKINTEMTAGEVIIINTNTGNKKITSLKNGVETNILNLLDLSSTFLQLKTGDNLFRYDADDNLNNLEVEVNFYERYMGV